MFLNKPNAHFMITMKGVRFNSVFFTPGPLCQLVFEAGSVFSGGPSTLLPVRLSLIKH